MIPKISIIMTVYNTKKFNDKKDVLNKEKYTVEVSG